MESNRKMKVKKKMEVKNHISNKIMNIVKKIEKKIKISQVLSMTNAKKILMHNVKFFSLINSQNISKI